MKEANRRARGLGGKELLQQEAHSRLVAGGHQLVRDDLEGFHRDRPLAEGLAERGREEKEIPALSPRGLLLDQTKRGFDFSFGDETARECLRPFPSGFADRGRRLLTLQSRQITSEFGIHVRSFTSESSRILHTRGPTRALRPGPGVVYSSRLHRAASSEPS